MSDQQPRPGASVITAAELWNLDYWLPIVTITDQGNTEIVHVPYGVSRAMRLLAHFRAIDWTDE